MKKMLFALLAVLALAVMPSAAHAGYGVDNSTDINDTDYPVRIVAYVVHPIGVALNEGIVQPIHRLLGRDGLAKWFGAEEKTEAAESE